MKRFYQKIKFAIAILGVATFLYSQTKHDNYWKIADDSSNRTPANLKIFEGRDPQLYQDYFSHNHKMEIEFWTDKSEESLRKRARLALHTAIGKTLTSKSGGGLSKDLFKKNLIESFTGHFLKSLYLLKIMNGTFQVDLHFSPSEMDSFNKLMQSNQFVDSNKTGTLLANLESKEEDFENVLSNRKALPSSRYKNMGGTITFWFKILDLNWNPINPIPNPAKNAVKGFVKYRRYFQMDSGWSPEISLANPKTTLKSDWEKNDKPRVITVDLTKNFNLKNLIPKADKVEIFFGKIKHPKHFRTGPIHNINLFSKDSRPNKFILSGQEGSKSYEFELKKLEFQLEDNKFTQSSKIKSHGNWDGFNIGQKRKFKSQVRHSMLGDDSLNLIKGLKLDRFHHRFKEVGSL